MLTSTPAVRVRLTGHAVLRTIPPSQPRFSAQTQADAIAIVQHMPHLLLGATSELPVLTRLCKLLHQHRQRAGRDAGIQKPYACDVRAKLKGALDHKKKRESAASPPLPTPPEVKTKSKSSTDLSAAASALADLQASEYDGLRSPASPSEPPTPSTTRCCSPEPVEKSEPPNTCAGIGCDEEEAARALTRFAPPKAAIECGAARAGPIVGS